MSAVWTFAWTPPGGTFLSAIGMREAPKEALTFQAYQNALVSRISRVVAATPPAMASRLLRVMSEREGLDIDGRLGSAAEMLVEHSSAMLDLLPRWFTPVPVDQLHHEPKTLKRLIERPMSLAAMLKKIYPPIPRWDE
jgi:hypothetical protein